MTEHESRLNFEKNRPRVCENPTSEYMSTQEFEEFGACFTQHSKKMTFDLRETSYGAYAYHKRWCDGGDCDCGSGDNINEDYDPSLDPLCEIGQCGDEKDL